MSGALLPQKLSSVDRVILDTWESILDRSLTQGKVDHLFVDLPAVGSPLRLYLLWRLLRAHMTWTFLCGQPPRVEIYLQKFPELQSCAEAVEDLKWLEQKIFRQSPPQPQPKDAPPPDAARTVHQ